MKCVSNTNGRVPFILFRMPSEHGISDHYNFLISSISSPKHPVQAKVLSQDTWHIFLVTKNIRTVDDFGFDVDSLNSESDNLSLRFNSCFGRFLTPVCVCSSSKTASINSVWFLKRKADTKMQFYI